MLFSLQGYVWFGSFLYPPSLYLTLSTHRTQLLLMSLSDDSNICQFWMNLDKIFLLIMLCQSCPTLYNPIIFSFFSCLIILLFIDYIGKDPDAGRDWGQGDDRGWDAWMASPTRWTWVWVNSGSWRWTGRPGMLRFMGLQSWTWLSDWTEELYCGIIYISFNSLL